MHAQQPRTELQPTSLRPPPPRILPRAIRGPPQPSGRVQRRTEQRHCPRRPTPPPLPQHRARRTARRCRLASVRIVTRWVQRVAAPRMHHATHHRHRMARTRLACPIMVHSHTATLRPFRPHAAPWQHRPKHPLLVRLVRRRRKDALASATRPVRNSPPLYVCLGSSFA